MLIIETKICKIIDSWGAFLERPSNFSSLDRRFFVLHVSLTIKILTVLKCIQLKYQEVKQSRVVPKLKSTFLFS